MKLKNRIINYFVTKPFGVDGYPKVYQCPVTIPAKTGEELLRKQLKKQGLELPFGSVLHVCYDLDSECIYVVNPQDFSKTEKDFLLKAAEVKIYKDFGALKNKKPIEGSPFSSIRVRSISNFGFVEQSIKEHFAEIPFVDLPVIEANLDRMVHTRKKLPEIFTGPNFVGGYISKNNSSHIDFIDELDNNGRKRKEPVLLLRQPTPFILINMAANKATSSDKERTVLFGYRDFINESGEGDKETIKNKASSFAGIYAAKRFLYYGYPFEEVCYTMLESAKNFGELYNAMQLLMRAANELEDEGYKNPAKIPYYLSFKIDPNTFQPKLSSMLSSDNKIDPAKQLPYFMVLEYNPTTKYVIIQTPAFLNEEICFKILYAKSRPLITHYNPTLQKIDVKSSQSAFKDYQVQGEQLAKINALTKHDAKKMFPDEKIEKIEYRSDERARGVSLSTTNICNIRKISDYYYATDHIQKLCKARNVPFMDLEVVVGPLARIFGPGVSGGFMDRKSFIKSKMKIPFEIEKGLFVTPPLIAIDSETMPGYDEQTATLIHEYSHNLFSITNPEWEHVYNTPESQRRKKQDENWWWYTYLTDADERQAHMEEIKHELQTGKSVDEIIRDKVGGQITTKNYPIALKFRELVNECIEQLEKEEEQHEKPTGSDK